MKKEYSLGCVVGLIVITSVVWLASGYSNLVMGIGIGMLCLFLVADSILDYIRRPQKTKRAAYQAALTVVVCLAVCAYLVSRLLTAGGAS